MRNKTNGPRVQLRSTSETARGDKQILIVNSWRSWTKFSATLTTGNERSDDDIMMSFNFDAKIGIAFHT
jgi:hypothetical protein